MGSDEQKSNSNTNRPLVWYALVVFLVIFIPFFFSFYLHGLTRPFGDSLWMPSCPDIKGDVPSLASTEWFLNGLAILWVLLAIALIFLVVYSWRARGFLRTALVSILFPALAIISALVSGFALAGYELRSTMKPVCECVSEIPEFARDLACKYINKPT